MVRLLPNASHNGKRGDAVRWLAPVLLISLSLTACGPQRATEVAAPGDGGAAPARERQSPAIVTRVEPGFLARKSLRQTGLTLGSTIRAFNAGLAISDANDRPQPYLAETLPQLNTESWQVFPDGRMETTYR